MRVAEAAPREAPTAVTPDPRPTYSGSPLAEPYVSAQSTDDVAEEFGRTQLTAVPQAAGVPHAAVLPARLAMPDSSAGAGAPTLITLRAPRLQRLLEVVPGVITWALIIAPIVLSFSFPEIVAWFVLSFDFYWFYKAIVLVASVALCYVRIRDVTAMVWRTRAFALADIAGRRAEIDRLVPLVEARVRELQVRGE